jgi:hypothetical protein
MFIELKYILRYGAEPIDTDVTLEEVTFFEPSFRMICPVAALSRTSPTTMLRGSCDRY